MSSQDPTINAPLLPWSDQPTSHSRSSPVSPTRSSARRMQSISQDPLLRDLSPTKTLRALTGSSTTGLEADLMKGLQNASESDRAFGARVAQACKDLRGWATEVESWDWPGTFAPPSRKERKSRRRRMLADHHVDASHFYDDSDEGEGGFWGSLPKELVQAYEVRIDDIQQAMAELDLDGLKNHVRSVHILPKSNKDHSREEYVSFRVRSMDDFTALITATILQALPYMSWLNRLLNEWSIRLIVLRKVPGFIHGMAETQKQLTAAWNELASDRHSSQESVGPVRGRIEGLQTVLGSKISALGQRLDSMLDELEGRPEALPDRWIDNFEALELAYSNWVVRAETTVTGLAWEFDLPASVVTGPLTPSYDGLGFVSDLDRSPLEGAQGLANADGSSASTMSERRVESPTLGHYPFASRGREQSIATTAGASSVRDRANSGFGTFVDDIVSQSQDEAHLHPLPDLRTIENADVPRSFHPSTRGTKRHNDIPSIAIPPKKSHSPAARPRHVPINVDPYREAALQASQTQPRLQEEEPYSFNREPPLPLLRDDEATPAVGSVAARRALFGANLEDKQTLLRTQSPVRPFEHATTAFTKLFRPSSSRERSRSRSNTLKKKRSQHRPSASFTPTESSTTSVPQLPTGLIRTSNDTNPRTDSIAASDVGHDVVSIPQIDRGNTPFSFLTSASQDQDPWSDKVLVAGPPPSHEDEGVSSADLRRSDRFDSPMALTQDSEYWPLPLDNRGTGEEISSPRKAIRSDAFEQLFVDTLPVSPIMNDHDLFAANLAAFEAYVNQIRSTDTHLNPTMDDAMMDGVYTHAIDAIKARRARRPKGMSGGKCGHRHKRSDGASSSREGDTSNLFNSPMSTPEIQEASTVGFGRPQEIRHSRRVKKHRSPKGDESKEALQTPSAARKEIYGTEKSRLYIQNDSDADCSGSEREPPLLPHGSQEKLPREPPVATAENSFTIISDMPAGVLDEPDTSAVPRSNRERSDTARSEPAFPLPPTFARSGHARSRSVKDTRSMLQALRSDSERSIIGGRLGADKPLPLYISNSATLMTLQSEAETTSVIQPEDSCFDVDPLPFETDAQPEQRQQSVASARGDDMDRHVSKVLKKMTSMIHFSAGEDQAIQTLEYGTARDQARTTQRKYSTEGITITPADASEPSVKRHLSDGETKMYHLQQPGRAHPIKLFVRLVGVDERVMVRVGGGWMNLEEYLRQYAEHHTHRTVIGGPIELVQAPRVVQAKEKEPESMSPVSPIVSSLSSSVPIRGIRDDLEETTTFSDVSNDESADAVVQSPELVIAEEAGKPIQSSESQATQDPGLAETSTPQPSLPEKPFRPEPLRSNPLFPKITALPSARPVSLQIRPGPSTGPSGPSLFPRITETPTVRPASLAIPRPGMAAPASAPPVRPGLEGQKARWVEMMLDRARNSTSAEKTGARARRSSLQNLGGVGSGAVKRLGLRVSSAAGPGRGN